MAIDDDDIIDPDEVELDDDIEDLDEDLDDEFEDDLDVVLDEDLEDVDDEDEDEIDDTDVEDADEALEDLEAEELELMDDEASQELLVDEAAELRAIRREELTMNVEAAAKQSDEFVCQSCFLVKRSSQLANRRKMVCRDCAE
ncbi:MAG: DUF4193 domain-containing protein [Acidimicrobiia bacterium]|nr:DUF4193 domain-containing protein [Acidimicrobiia bacterium]